MIFPYCEIIYIYLRIWQGIGIDVDVVEGEGSDPLKIRGPWRRSPVKPTAGGSDRARVGYGIRGMIVLSEQLYPGTYIVPPCSRVEGGASGGETSPAGDMSTDL